MTVSETTTPTSTPARPSAPARNVGENRRPAEDLHPHSQRNGAVAGGPQGLRLTQMPSHVSMMRLTACATRAGGRGNPSAPVR